MTKYEIIFESLQEKVNSGELTIEHAEMINQLAYDKYVVEHNVDIQSEIVNDRLQQQYRSKYGKKKRPTKDMAFYQDNLSVYDHGDNRWKDNLKPQRKSGLHQDQQLYGDDPKIAFTASNKKKWDQGRGEDVKRRSEDIDKKTKYRVDVLKSAIDSKESLKNLQKLDNGGDDYISKMVREDIKDRKRKLTINKNDSKSLKKLKRQLNK